MSLFTRFRAIFGGMGDHDGWQQSLPLTSPVSDARGYPPDAAVQLAAVWACVDLLARTMGTLPCDVFRWDENGRRETDTKSDLHLLLGVSPNRLMTPFDFWQAMTLYWALRGNAYALIRRKAGGSAYSLSPLNPDQMNVLLEDGRVTYQYYDRHDSVVTYSEDDILHWKCMGNGIIGLSKFEYMRASLTEAVDAQANAISVFKDKGKISGIISAPGVTNNKQRAEIAEQFRRMKAGGGIPVLPVEAKFTQLALSPADTELLATRKFSTEEIARWFGVPVCLIYGAEAKDWAAAMQQFYKVTILPMCVALEQAITKRVCTTEERRRYRVKFRLSAVNRAADKDRFELYARAVQNGLMTRNEVRRLEDMEDMEGADALTAQTNLLPIDMLGQQDPSQEPQAAISEEPQKQ